MLTTTDTTVSLSLPCLGWLCSLGWVSGCAYAQAQLSFFLDQSMQPGHLLHGWRVWTENRWGTSSRRPRWWSKPLGGCVLCMNVWLAAANFALLAAFAPPRPLSLWPLWLLAFIVLSNAWLRTRLARL